MAALILSVVSSLIIFVPQVHAAAITWTGTAGDDKLGTAGNWSGNVLPVDGDSLVFPFSSSGYSLDLDASSTLTSVSDITFTGDGSAVSPQLETISSSASSSITITGAVSVGSNVNASIDLPITTGASTSANIIDSTASLVFGSDTNPVTLGGNTLTFSNLKSPINSSSDQSFLTLGQLIGSSSSKVVFNGLDVNLNNTSPSFDGEMQFNNSLVDAQVATVFGTSVGGIKLNNSRLQVTGSSEIVINDPVDVVGNYLGADSTKGVIGTEVFYVGGSSGSALNLAGGLTLHNDTLFDPYVGPIKVTGAFDGKFSIGITAVYTPASAIIINSSSNNSSVPNGNYALVSSDTTISDSLPATDLIVESGKTLTLSGVRGRIIVSSKSTLKGTGTAGAVNIFNGADIAPGNSPGCINSGDITINGTYDAEIGGNTACSGYDQLNVTGTVDVTGSKLNPSLYNGYTPKAGESYTIINNDGSDPIVGTFNNLAEGTTFNLGSTVFKISYVGGTGNDVVLSVQTVPGTPNTGIKLLTTYPVFTMISTLLLASSIAFIARRYKRSV